MIENIEYMKKGRKRWEDSVVEEMKAFAQERQLPLVFPKVRPFLKGFINNDFINIMV